MVSLQLLSIAGGRVVLRCRYALSEKGIGNLSLIQKNNERQKNSTFFTGVNFKIGMIWADCMATIGDIVLVYKEDQPAFFARIEDVWADKKPEWFHVKLLILQVPVVEVVWILREAYLNGDPFTMSGMPLRLEKVSGVSERATPLQEREQAPAEKTDGRRNKVVSLFDRKKD
jgi:hypothetical protein